MILATGLLVAACQSDDFVEQPMPEPEPIPPEPEDIYEDIVEPPEDILDEIQEEQVRVIEVEGYGRTFEPDVITVEVGETVEFVFTNTGGTHDFVIPSLGVGTDVINEGETDSFTYTFDEEGIYDFECSVDNHAGEGMVGEIVVI
ncbi:MAG: plastocyanin/azurin family copper-binding protein [Candidatus Woesearchaeota archaeon]